MRDRVRQIHALLETLPVVDVHSHLGQKGPWQARHLADLLAYHWLSTETGRAMGEKLPEWIRDDPDGFCERVAPHIGKARNTGNHYAFMGMLRDLYDVDARTVTPDNWRDIDARVRATADDDDHVERVLARGNIEKVCILDSDAEARPSPRFFPYAFGEICYAVHGPHGFKGLTGGGIPESADAWEEMIVATVAKWDETHGVRALHDWGREQWRYVETTPEEADMALAALRSGRPPTPTERDRLQSFCADVTAREAGKRGMVIQVFHGSARYTDAATASYVTHWNRDFLPRWSVHLAKHRETRFELFLGTGIASHEAASFARVHVNLMPSGAWWHGFTPSTMTAYFRDRLEMLPHTAWNAFFSDGYLVEWIYAKLTVTRNRLAHALAGMVEEGFLTDEDVPEVAENLLYRNPMAAYGLDA